MATLILSSLFSFHARPGGFHFPLFWISNHHGTLWASTGFSEAYMLQYFDLRGDDIKAALDVSQHCFFCFRCRVSPVSTANDRFQVENPDVDPFCSR